MSYKGFVEINIVKAEKTKKIEENILYILIFDMQFYNFGMKTCAFVSN